MPGMQIAVIGASGWLGGAIAREALARGHEVTAIARNASGLEELEGANPAVADATDGATLMAVLLGHDAVVAAVTDRSAPDRRVIPEVARTLIKAAPASSVPRVAWVGGGASLNTPDGGRFIDQPGFPEEYKAEAMAQAEALDLFRSAPPEVDWTYLSPPVHELVPGDKQGGYRVAGGDEPVTDADGNNRVNSGDFAAAMVDELERPQFSRQRFTVGY
jgi:uncharacterized protein